MTTQQGDPSGDVGSVELRGRVKWFNAVKGYGFLALETDNSDAFRHVTTLRQSGHEDLKPGATVVCSGVRGPKGWQVMKVLEVDSSTAVAVASYQLFENRFLALKRYFRGPRARPLTPQPLSRAGLAEAAKDARTR